MKDPVVQSVDTYVASFPTDGRHHSQAVYNVITANWGKPDDEGRYGRQIVLDDYFQGIKDPNLRVQEADQLKVDLGLGQWMTPTSNGTPTYGDNGGLSADEANLVTQINEAAGIS
jgi:hypothetical protein